MWEVSGRTVSNSHLSDLLVNSQRRKIVQGDFHCYFSSSSPVAGVHLQILHGVFLKILNPSIVSDLF